MDKVLKLKIQPRVIDHLGIKMYQKAVDVISEFIANGWDADAEGIEVKLDNSSICIVDNGHGMTFNECQNYYLTVGRDRRKDTGTEFSKGKQRPVLGRKGIGKFAGFGIAKTIQIETISSETGEKTVFKMEISKILEADQQEQQEKLIEVVTYDGPDEARKAHQGTKIILSEVASPPTEEEIIDELSRRFLLTQFYDDFDIKVNSKELPESFSDAMEFVFPRDLTAEEKVNFPNLQGIEGDWAKETFLGHEIKWRVGFYEETIKTEELRGISIFAKGKLAQKPFFFDLAGGISGQNALEYMTGQIRMDFIDTGNNDLIATERQRINLQTPTGKLIRNWGIDRIKLLSSIWKSRRSAKRLQELNDRISGFRERLDSLPSTERKTVETVLKKIASFPRLGQGRFRDWCNDILTSWEAGRLRNIITEMSQAQDMDETKFIEILSEADILTSINIAESIKTKIISIGELKQRIQNRELENKVRDYIYEHPWIIHPKWESFKKERSVKGLIDDVAKEKLNTEAFKGRVDLAMSSGDTLLLLEFMRPGIPIDTDHLDRINYYVVGIRRGLNRITGSNIRRLDTAYVIADDKRNSEDVYDRIQQLEDENIYVLTWNTLIEQSLKQWEEHLEIIKSRNPNDKRIQDL